MTNEPKEISNEPIPDQEEEIDIEEPKKLITEEDKVPETEELDSVEISA